MDSRPPFAALLFALVVGALALVDSLLQGDLDRETLALLAGGAAPVIAFSVMALTPRRRNGIAA